MIPLPILHPVRWEGHGYTRFIVLGHCADKHGGNTWIIKATAASGEGFRPDWNGGARAARTADLTPIVPKVTRGKGTK